MRHGGSSRGRTRGMGGVLEEGSGGGERGAAMSCLVEAPGWRGREEGEGEGEGRILQLPFRTVFQV